MPGLPRPCQEAEHHAGLLARAPVRLDALCQAAAASAPDSARTLVPSRGAGQARPVPVGMSLKWQDRGLPGRSPRSHLRVRGGSAARCIFGTDAGGSFVTGASGAWLRRPEPRTGRWGSALPPPLGDLCVGSGPPFNRVTGSLIKLPIPFPDAVCRLWTWLVVGSEGAGKVDVGI